MITPRECGGRVGSMFGYLCVCEGWISVFVVCASSWMSLELKLRAPFVLSLFLFMSCILPCLGCLG